MQPTQRRRRYGGWQGASATPLDRTGTDMTDAAPVIDLDALDGRTTIIVEEAASLLGIGRSAAYEAARRGQLPARRLGRRFFVPVPALLEWLGASAYPERGTPPQP